MDLSKVRGHIEEMWIEDDGGLHFNMLADDQYVCGDPPNSLQMQVAG